MRYSAAIFICASVLAAQYFILVYGKTPALGLLYPCIFFIALTLGLGPALVGIALATVGALFLFYEPQFAIPSLSKNDVLRLSLFVVTSAVVSWIVERARRAAIERDHALTETKEALRTRDEFVSVASHELKTPLTSLSLQIQMLIRTLNRSRGLNSDPSTLNIEQFHDTLIRCERQSIKLARLLDELLDLSRIRLGLLQLAKERLSLTSVTEEVVERFREAHFY